MCPDYRPWSGPAALTRDPRLVLVRAVGLEPTWSNDLDFLRVLRLPVPPHPHRGPTPQTKGCDTLASRSRCSEVRPMSRASTLSSSCSGREAPTIGAVTAGWASSQARATRAGLT